jgi:hypothetical protein
MAKGIKIAGVVFSTALFAVAFWAFVWPTPWMYRQRGGTGELLRINRISGRVEVLSHGAFLDAAIEDSLHEKWITDSLMILTVLDRQRDSVRHAANPFSDLVKDEQAALQSGARRR